jgi:hypothetical protein
MRSAFPDSRLVLEPDSLQAIPDSSPLLVKYFPRNSWVDHVHLKKFDKTVILVRHPLAAIVSQLFHSWTHPRYYFDEFAANAISIISGVEHKDSNRRLSDLFDVIGRSDSLNELTESMSALVATARSDASIEILHYENYGTDIRNSSLSELIQDTFVDVGPIHEFVERSKDPEEWRNWLSPEEWSVLSAIPQVQEFAATFGYDLKPGLVEQPVRNPANGSEYFLRNINRNRARASFPPLELTEPASNSPGILPFLNSVIDEAENCLPDALQNAMLALLDAPDHAGYQFQLGRLANGAGLHVLAQAALVRSTRQLPPNARAWQQLSACYSSLGETELAIDAARLAAELEPYRGGLLHEAALLLHSSGRWLEAEPLLRDALRCDDHAPLMAMTLARNLWEQGRPQDALDAMPSLQAIDEHLAYHELRARLLLELGRYDEALAAVGQAWLASNADLALEPLRDAIRRRLDGLSQETAD